MNYGLGNMMMGGGSAADGAPSMGQSLMPMGAAQPQGNPMAQLKGGLASMLNGGKIPPGLLQMLQQLMGGMK